MSSGFERIRDLYKQREETALGQFGATRRQEQRTREEWERIAAIGAEYREKLKSDGQRGIDAGRLKHLRSFVHQLQQGEEQVNLKVKRAEESSRVAERAWRHQHRRAAGVDALIDADKQRRAQHDRRREQAEHDDMAQGQAQRRR